MVVIDVNAALSMAMGSEEGEALSLLLNGEEEIIAPSLMNAELAHALAKYIRCEQLSADQATAYGRDALGLVDRFVDDNALWIEAMNESVRLGHSSYDLFYFLLARREGATLFTLDRKLQNLCMRNGVSCLGTQDL